MDENIKKNELKNVLNKLCNMEDLLPLEEIQEEINKTDKKRVNNFVTCDYCGLHINRKNLKKHYKKCLEYKKFNTLDKQKPIQEEKTRIKNIPCPYCHKKLFDIQSLTTHIKSKHIERWEKYINDDEVKRRISALKLNLCNYCGAFVKSLEKHYKKCSKYKKFNNLDKNVLEEENTPANKEINKEEFWSYSSPIKEISEESGILDNIQKHQAINYQYREEEDLDPDLVIDEEEYQRVFEDLLADKSKRIRDRVTFEHEKVYNQEEEDKSEIKIFLSKMYKGYCQVCGFTFKKTNGENSFERFNWNDKRVVKVKKSFVSTADSLSLCRNCSANIKWGAFYPNFVDTIKKIENFREKSYDEIKEILHKVVDKNIPKVFESHLEFDIYALEIELNGKSRNIYFTNEHLLQFITYLQREDELEEKIKEKKKQKRRKEVIDRIYSKNPWLAREETIPKELAKSFLRVTAKWDHPIAGRYVDAPKHADNIYKNNIHGWAIDFGANSFLVGKAIERCKNEINKYLENNYSADNKLSFLELKEKLFNHIRGAVATGNNYEYRGYYPVDDGYMKFGVQCIDVGAGVDFLIQRLWG